MIKAIITGHSRGLGAALAAALLSKDIQVQVLGLARATNTDLQQRFGERLQQHALDLADSAALAQWSVSGAMQRFLDGCELALLINNAGMVGPVGSAASVSAAESARAIALNVAAPLLLTAAFTQATAQAGERRVMHISSGAGRNAYPGWGVYCASKAALDHHARAAALDQVPRLRICSIAPGVIDTDMQAQIRAAALEDFPARQRFEAMKRNGELADADSSAEALVGYLLDQRFGASPVEDIRTWA